MQWVLVKFMCAFKEAIKYNFLLVDITLQQCLGEIAFVWKVIEKTTLGNAHGCDDLFDGCGSKSLGENGVLCHFQNAFTFVAATIHYN